VISANTQARTEGYFRLEWRLADQRTHLMAKGRPFLLPVVIDDTRDAEAHVPDSFTEVQWTRLPGGETPPAFCARVKKLLGGEGAPVSDRRSDVGRASCAPKKTGADKPRPYKNPPALGSCRRSLALPRSWDSHSGSRGAETRNRLHLLRPLFPRPPRQPRRFPKPANSSRRRRRCSTLATMRITRTIFWPTIF
jgi:hypothetical protein